MKKKIIATAGITGACIGITVAAGYLVFNEIMNRNAGLAQKLGKFFVGESGLEVPTEPDERALWYEKQTFQKYEIINRNGFNLKGYYLPSEKKSNIYVLLNHGYRSSGMGEFFLLTKYYYDKGINVFMVDHQAAGESEGKYIGFGYHEHFDSLQWIDFMKEQFGDEIQVILHGISMGCATVTMMSDKDLLPDCVKFIVADCGYTSAYDEFAHNIENMHMTKFPILNIANFFNKKISGYDFKDANPIESVKNAEVPMLFIHGSNDDFVPVNMVYKLYDACGSKDKDLIIIEGAGHAESYPKDSKAYEDKINIFADKYIKW